ncbi:MAG: KpsF/GutQ family sugar-phosphate isomerase [Gammaproteobacteria bacterium]|jgi:arabinose-5-phosphate isomerase|nr:KpsF/GutQ family sugar-phosphate isomerase [Gammaproteobacteria bacterium]
MTSPWVNSPTSRAALIESARKTLHIELAAVAALDARLDEAFARACEIILNSSGRVVVIGMGKSGHIGRKIAATLASTGTTAMFVHPAEASHGDIGMIAKNDVVLALSNSGSTEEIVGLLPVLKRQAIPLISLTGNPHSELALAAEANLDAQVAEEACPLGLAPTSSTTAALVLGDALAMALLEARGFTREDFAFSHPGGNLGRRLLVRVRDVMHEGTELPRVATGTPLSDALLEMTSKGFGLTTVTDSAGALLGVFSDGDLRRALDAGVDIRSTRVDELMSSDYRFIASSALAAEAAAKMQDASVYVLIVSDSPGQLSGLIKMHDLLRANVV